MLFQYIAKGYSKTVCGNCYADIIGSTLPDNVTTWIDGLPVGYERLFLDECVNYCPNCGQAVINSAHLRGFNEIVKCAPNLPKKTVLEAIYKKFANDYVLGAFYEYHDNPGEAETYYRSYLNKQDPLPKLATMNDYQKLEFVDIYRRLGEFDNARTILKTIKFKLTMDELTRWLLKTEEKAVKSLNKERIEIPGKLNYFIL